MRIAGIHCDITDLSVIPRIPGILPAKMNRKTENMSPSDMAVNFAVRMRLRIPGLFFSAKKTLRSGETDSPIPSNMIVISITQETTVTTGSRSLPNFDITNPFTT